MEKINEEIVGGLISALSRGELLEKAMMTFYNAGYEKKEIEDSAKEVYRQLGPEAMGVKDGSLQETLDEIATKAGVITKKKAEPEVKREEKFKEELQLQRPTPKRPPQTNNYNMRREGRVPQNVSNYGQKNYTGPYRDAEDITNKIERAIKGLKKINIPSRIEIVQRNPNMKPAVAQNVSNYSGNPPKSVNKAITYVLIAILLLLLGALAAVFLFKEDLIKLFNNLGLG